MLNAFFKLLNVKDPYFCYSLKDINPILNKCGIVTNK